MDKPETSLNGRIKFSTEFVNNSEIKDKRILDIGCGFGWFELNALKRGVREIAGIEITEEDLATAKNIKNKRVIFKVGDAFKIPFKNNYFDTVVAWEVIEHIPKDTEEIMFKEVRRVLKKNGNFYLSTPYDSFWSKNFDPAWWILGHRHYSKETLIKLGENNKMHVLRIEVKGKVWNLLNIINMYISKWIFLRRPLLETFFNNKEIIEFRYDGFMDIFIKYKKTI
ncbi:MAG: hypothetical protein A2798_01965 [Candidatus Levybacteria bacterium RIFCSPHIGHO2_01_FULL_37_17]|nr:MAG: hypothetical protein A2798_01965 [Candidatus Levybacteria bacterium RIFCSPHIGHO2_01_FULL_37_17]